MPEFQALLNTDLVNEWFLPELLERLHFAGRMLAPSDCSTFATLPVFSQGKYEVSNLNPVPAREHFAITGCIIREIQGLPDGAQVRITVVCVGQQVLTLGWPEDMRMAVARASGEADAGCAGRGDVVTYHTNVGTNRMSNRC